MYKASAPGSLMLFGEYAVLHGKLALVAAIDKRIHVSLTPRNDTEINIYSAVFGQHSFTLDALQIKAPFEYVLTSIKSQSSRIEKGFDLLIDAEFSAQLGLGSSAAVTVATLAVIQKWLYGKHQHEELYKNALKVITEVQGGGSGADIAASIHGGVLNYKMQPVCIEAIIDSLPLVIIYSGNKFTTQNAIKKIKYLFQQYPEIFSQIFDVMDKCSYEACAAIKLADLEKVGALMNLHQGQQDALGTNNELLAQIIFALRSYPTIYGAKISGSGLGDCVIGLGTIPPKTFPLNEKQKENGIIQLDVKINSEGVR